MHACRIGADRLCWVGCCGWREARSRYFSHFPVVELQETFYEPPSPVLAAKWRALAPAEFRFTLKAWQLITHTPASPTYRRLKSKLSPSEHEDLGSFRPTEQVWLAWERTQAIARVLQASVVLFQCPASFTPSRENVQNLRDFFARVGQHEWQLAWEPRGGWPLELVKELCTELNLLHCVDPLQADPVTTGTLYWRLHGRGGYHYRYTDEELVALHDKVKRFGSRTSTADYVLFNNVYMKEDALRFQQLFTE